MGTRLAPSLLMAPLLALAACEALLDDHDKVDVDFCGGYKGDDECCAEDDPCDLGDDLGCQCSGCGWDRDDCTMLWTFTDACDDGYAIDVGVYQVGADGYYDETADEPKWEGLTLEELGEAYELETDCTPGEYTCWGAWADSGMTWGCGSGCQQYCPDCCYYCDLSGVVVRTLICE